MRLVNATTLELEEFLDVEVPPYAILSHTWADGEVSFNDWNDKRNRIYKPGYQKIAHACAEAAKDGLQYVWADVNCIDKSSSAELSEAINSMFRYYKRAVVCYAYLADVEWCPLTDCKRVASPLRHARWFTRGWTLQELIAPSALRFYSADWRVLGTKVDLAFVIAETTGVGLWCLLRGSLHKQNQNPLRGYSIAQRLCWASRRDTARIEDRAYSLLGLFDISMPLVYGEGHNAFARLLEEIVRKYPDQSFLCSQLRYVDFLPRSPKDYDCSQHVILQNSPRLRKYYTPATSYPYHFQMTNVGLQMTLSLVGTLSADLVFAVLDCWDADSEINERHRYISRIWMPLMRKGPDIYSRMLWPQTFFPVRLLPKDVILNHDSAKPEAGSDEDAISKAVIDLISSHSRRSMLIKKSFAATVIVRQYQFQDAASPFLICFPREMPGYLPYGIFPETPDTKAHLHLSLVMARNLDGEQDEIEEQPSQDEQGGKPGRRHGALVVFRKRNTQPPAFLAILLVNTLLKDQLTGETGYNPSCKIIPHWAPPQDDTTPEAIAALAGDGLRGLSQHDGVLVAVQKIPVAANRGGAQHVGLVQVVFDLHTLRGEVRAATDAQQKGAANSLWNYFGRTTSDVEDDDTKETFTV